MMLIIDCDAYFLYFYPNMIAKDFSRIWTRPIAIQVKACTTTSLNHVWKQVLIIDFNNYIFPLFLPQNNCKGF